MGRSVLRVALVGAGRIALGEHLPAWSAERRAKVVAIVDSRPAAARAAAQHWGVDLWSEDLAAVLPRGIDAVDVCTPALAHLGPTLQALQAGKHVLLEKPPAVFIAEAKAMAAKAHEEGTILMVAENWPFSSTARQARRHLRQGRLGRIFLVHAIHESGLRLVGPTGPHDIDRLPLGYLLAAGIHVIHLSRVMIGELSSVAAFSSTKASVDGSDLPSDDDLVLAAQFETGALGSFYFTGRARQIGERRLMFRIFGTSGTLEFDILRGHVRLTTTRSERLTVLRTNSMGFVEEIRHFVDCVRAGRQPETSLDDYVRTLETVRRIYESAVDGSIVRVTPGGNRPAARGLSTDA